MPTVAAPAARLTRPGPSHIQIRAAANDRVRIAYAPAQGAAKAPRCSCRRHALGAADGTSAAPTGASCEQCSTATYMWQRAHAAPCGHRHGHQGRPRLGADGLPPRADGPGPVRPFKRRACTLSARRFTLATRCGAQLKHVLRGRARKATRAVVPRTVSSSTPSRNACTRAPHSMCIVAAPPARSHSDCLRPCRLCFLRGKHKRCFQSAAVPRGARLSWSVI